MKRILMIVAQNNFRDEEFKEPKKIFVENGFEVIVASERADEARGTLGLRLPIRLSFRNLDIRNYDALVLVGGHGMMDLWHDENLIQIVQEAKRDNKVIGAICIAPVVLANAGVLAGKNATVSAGAEARLTDKGANYIDSDVVIDGKIITANGPEAAEKFGEKVVEVINNESV